MTAKRDELDKLGVELWNLSTRLRRDDPAQNGDNGKINKGKVRNSSTVCLLRVYAFLLLDSAGSQMVKGRERKSCIRLMKLALKAAKVSISGKELESATRVLERAAAYEDILTGEGHHHDSNDADIAKRLRLEYFAVRTVLVRPRPLSL